MPFLQTATVGGDAIMLIDICGTSAMTAHDQNDGHEVHSSVSAALPLDRLQQNGKQERRRLRRMNTAAPLLLSLLRDPASTPVTDAQPFQPVPGAAGVCMDHAQSTNADFGALGFAFDSHPLSAVVGIIVACGLCIPFWLSIIYGLYLLRG